MKKILVLLVAALVAMPALAQSALDYMPKYKDPKNPLQGVQDKLNEEILGLIRDGKIEDAYTVLRKMKNDEDDFAAGPSVTTQEQSFMRSVRRVPRARIPAWMKEQSAFSKIDTVGVKEDPNDKKLETDGSEADKALYYALTKYYIELFGEDPIHLNVPNYAAFYKRFADTPLAGRTEIVMMLLWQQNVFVADGEILFKVDKKNLGNTGKNLVDTGKKLFDTIDLAKQIGTKDPYKYAKGKFSVTGPEYLVRSIQHIYDGLYARSEEKNDKKIFHTVKTLWWNYILDTPNGKYSEGKDTARDKDVIRLLADYDQASKKKWEAWKTLTITPATDGQRKRVKDLYDECRAEQQFIKEGMCDKLKDKAVQYGYLSKSDKEVEAHVSKTLRGAKLLAL